MTHSAQILPGNRLHLHHGPIDLIIGTDGDRAGAFQAAEARFATLLSELVPELDLLKTPLSKTSPLPTGQIAKAMHRACLPFCDSFVTPMAAVAGAVADAVLSAMKQHDLTRAYVNNGGDIALFLAQGARFKMAISGLDGRALGEIDLTSDDGIKGVATSGRQGRSLSFGIADAVTVLADNAAAADVAATLIANKVNLPGHPHIKRACACDLFPDTDLGARKVTSSVGPLTLAERNAALEAALPFAEHLVQTGQIKNAALFLGDAHCVVSPLGLSAAHPNPRMKDYA